MSNHPAFPFPQYYLKLNISISDINLYRQANQFNVFITIIAIIPYKKAQRKAAPMDYFLAIKMNKPKKKSVYQTHIKRAFICFYLILTEIIKDYIKTFLTS